MADWLRRLGYLARACGLWLNLGCSDAALGIVRRATEDALEQTGRRVAVLGHSRGGRFAKAIAAGRPLMVSYAISVDAALASPFDISVPRRAAVTLVRAWDTPELLQAAGDAIGLSRVFSPYPRRGRTATTMSARRTGCLRSTASTS